VHRANDIGYLDEPEYAGTERAHLRLGHDEPLALSVMVLPAAAVKLSVSRDSSDQILLRLVRAYPAFDLDPLAGL
jgi:hypothetical protein